MPHKTFRSLIDWWFCDRRTGRIVVAQVPNLPILLWLGTLVAQRLATVDSGMQLALAWAGTVFLTWWAVDEFARGVNPFRRLLGLVGCAAVVAIIVGRLA